MEVTGVLDRLRVPYMLIGGLAVSLWGEPRSTLDVDVTIWVESENFEHTISEIGKLLNVLPKEPISFVRSTRVLPCMSSQQVKIDVIFAALEEERRSSGRSLYRPGTLPSKSRPSKICSS